MLTDEYMWESPNIGLKKQSWASDNFLASRQRQRDNVIEPQGQEKIRKIFRSRCLHAQQI